jgi:hypothetical protein
MHLDSGLMGPGQGADDSSDETSANPTPTLAPAPPPAWVPPPAPPPAVHDFSNPFSDPFSSSSESEGTSASAQKVESATVAPVATDSVSSSNGYEKLFNEDSPGSHRFSWEKEAAGEAKKSKDDVKPLSYSWDKPGSSFSAPFDDAQKLIDAAPAVPFSEPGTPVKTAATHAESVSTPVSDDWMSAFDEPAKPMKSTVSPAHETPVADNNWMSTFGGTSTDKNDATEAHTVSKQVATSGSDEPAIEKTIARADWALDSGLKGVVGETTNWSADDKASKATPKEEDPIARMRRLLAKNSLLQTTKKGHMVSIKLHRSK